MKTVIGDIGKLTLDMTFLPEMFTCDKRQFAQGEKHCDRTASYDVLIIMLSGVLIFYEDGTRRELHGGEWYLQRKGLSQQGIEESDEPEYYYIHMNCRTVESKGNGYLFGTFNENELLPEIEELYHLCQGTDNSTIKQCSVFYSILLKLFSGSSEFKSKSVLGKAMEKYIIDHCFGDFSISVMSEFFGYSQNYVIRFFKQYSGTTPYKFATDLRIRKALMLLEQSSLSVDSIAESVGYNDVSSMYRAFIKQKGSCPSEFRKC